MVRLATMVSVSTCCSNQSGEGSGTCRYQWQYITSSTVITTPPSDTGRPIALFSCKRWDNGAGRYQADPCADGAGKLCEGGSFCVRPTPTGRVVRTRGAYFRSRPAIDYPPVDGISVRRFSPIVLCATCHHGLTGEGNGRWVPRNAHDRRTDPPSSVESTTSNRRVGGASNAHASRHISGRPYPTQTHPKDAQTHGKKSASPRGTAPHTRR